MLKQFEVNCPLVAVAVTSTASPDVVVPATLQYKARGRVELATGVTTAQALIPAFAATTAYVRNQVVQSGGIIYSAKYDFTSGAAISLADWNAFGSNALLAWEYRWVSLFLRKNSAGAFVVFSECSPLLQVGVDGVQYNMAVQDATSTQDAVLLAKVLCLGAMTIGTTNLSASNSIIIPNPADIGG